MSNKKQRAFSIEEKCPSFAKAKCFRGRFQYYIYLQVLFRIVVEMRGISNKFYKPHGWADNYLLWINSTKWVNPSLEVYKYCLYRYHSCKIKQVLQCLHKYSSQLRPTECMHWRSRYSKPAFIPSSLASNPRRHRPQATLYPQSLREILTLLLNRALNPQQNRSLPLIQLTHLIV